MDILSIGTAVGVAVINNLTMKITDGDNSTKLVDWVLSVGEYFWKSTKKKLSINEQPPQLGKSGASENTPVINLDDFTTKRRIDQITSLMEQLHTYSSNLNKDLERAARLGGVDSPDMTHKLYNSIQDQKREIVNCFIQLTDTINKLYGETVDGLDDLKKAIED